MNEGSEINIRLVTVEVATEVSMLCILRSMECNVPPSRLLVGPVSEPTSVNVDLRTFPTVLKLQP
jgi:hypothetical protein